ncbi:MULTISPECIES: DUF6587 family protein [Stenotrophomonas]|uniref:DUF6587 family protein n=1 Tax=Stenotrophomonas TaxID=40323 RepID=UPI000871BD94|nr:MULTISPECIES: DUF6587 family protein [Stenotrophomonas]OEZ02005.1 hypothetical protein BIY45_03410 [Stenotrophomonas sp. BIIR7]
MDTGLLLQYVVVALIVLASAWVVVKKQMPGTVRRVRGAAALSLLKPQRAAWLQALGRRIAPPANSGGAGCGGCDSCGPTPPAARPKR